MRARRTSRRTAISRTTSSRISIAPRTTARRGRRINAGIPDGRVRAHDSRGSRAARAALRRHRDRRLRLLRRRRALAVAAAQPAARSARDLVVHGNDLIAATHGRAFWILDDVSPLRQLSDAMRREPVHLFAPDTAIRVGRRTCAQKRCRRAESAVGRDRRLHLPREAEGPRHARVPRSIRQGDPHVLLEGCAGEDSANARLVGQERKGLDREGAARHHGVTWPQEEDRERRQHVVRAERFARQHARRAEPLRVESPLRGCEAHQGDPHRLRHAQRTDGAAGKIQRAAHRGWEDVHAAVRRRQRSAHERIAGGSAGAGRRVVPAARRARLHRHIRQAHRDDGEAARSTRGAGEEGSRTPRACQPPQSRCARSSKRFARSSSRCTRTPTRSRCTIP